MKKLLLFVFLSFCALTASSQPGSGSVRLSPMVKTVPGVQHPVVSLNGRWNFQTASIPMSTIDVPGEWVMQGYSVADGETACYSRKITLPADWMGKRIKIRFDGVSSYGLVKVNGITIGEHEGGMVPFELDITPAVKQGDNELQVEVRAGTISDRLGCVSQYACHTVGGLLRKVTLFVLPEVNVAGMDVVTALDRSNKHAELIIDTEVAEEVPVQEAVSLQHTLTDASGKIIATKTFAANKTSKNKAVLSVRNARLWNSEQPYLYTLTTTLLRNGKPVQVNEQRVGIRQVEVKGNVLYVNGRPVKLHGVNRHEVHPLRGRSLTPELCRQDAELFKAGNCNYIRTSHYPPSEEFLEACDEIGLFVESEAALTWIQHHASPIWQKWDYLDEQYVPFLIRANQDNILAGRKHPSVIIWSLGNESRWSPLWEKVQAVVEAMDPSRPNSFHDQCWGGFNNAGSTADIANLHYPGISGPAACDTMARPVLFGEYAHLTCYNSRELVTDPGVRAAYGKYLVQMYDSIYSHAACLGGAIWSGIDDIFHVPGGQITGYGPWGPIDGWRRGKPEYTGMKKAYTPFRILDYERRPGQLELMVENRFNFLAFDQIRIEAGERNGSMHPVKSTIPARSKGKIVIPLIGNLSQDIYLKVSGTNGLVYHEEVFADDDMTEESRPVATLTVEDGKEGLTIRSVVGADIQTILFNKTTGLISKAFSGNNVLLQQGPVFCLVPMNADDGGKPNVAGETYQNLIFPLKNYPHLTLFANSFQCRKTGDGNVIVEVEASYLDGDRGKITYLFTTDRKIHVEYEMKMASEEVRPRQYGLVLQLPRQMENLRWKRKGDFTVYPANDIARTEGTARLNANALYEAEAWRQPPAHPWKDDSNILGSTDFRSTKTQLLTGSLTNGSGSGITVYGNGTQAWRSWLQDGCIHLLIADYSNTGSEPFYGSPFSSERITVKKEDILRGKMTFEIY